MGLKSTKFQSKKKLFRSIIWSLLTILRLQFPLFSIFQFDERCKEIGQQVYIYQHTEGWNTERGPGKVSDLVMPVSVLKLFHMFMAQQFCIITVNCNFPHVWANLTRLTYSSGHDTCMVFLSANWTSWSWVHLPTKFRSVWMI